MRKILCCLLLLAGSLSGPGHAVIETYEFENDELYERYELLSDELRCPKCQNQNIAASNAPIAQDLRKELHKQLHEGKSDEEIVDFMVQRFGEFVLYRPRWSAATALLWLAPVILLGLGTWILAGLLRRGQAESATGAGTDSVGTHLTEEEQARIDSLLKRETDHD